MELAVCNSFSELELMNAIKVTQFEMLILWGGMNVLSKFNSDESNQIKPFLVCTASSRNYKPIKYYC